MRSLVSKILPALFAVLGVFVIGLGVHDKLLASKIHAAKPCVAPQTTGCLLTRTLPVAGTYVSTSRRSRGYWVSFPVQPGGGLSRAQVSWDAYQQLHQGATVPVTSYNKTILSFQLNGATVSNQNSPTHKWWIELLMGLLVTVVGVGLIVFRRRRRGSWMLVDPL